MNEDPFHNIDAKRNICDERVSLVTYLLHSNFTRKRWYRISVRQWINRLLILYQRPIIFLIYRQEENNGPWMLVFDTHRDYAYRTTFEKDILNERKYHASKNIGNEKQISLNSNSGLTPNPIPGTIFGILLVEVVRDRHTVNFSILKNEAREYTLLTCLWEKFLISEYSKCLGVTERMTRNLKELFAVAKSGEIPKKPEITDFSENSLGAEIIKDQISILSKEIIDDLYKSLSQTPLASNNGKTPPNLFFFLRYYDRDEFRNRTSINDKEMGEKDRPYPYSLRIIIPETQEQHIRETFENIRNAKREGDTWIYAYNDFNGNGIEETHDEYDDEHLKKWFWKEIKESGAITRFLKILRKPFGKETRGLADPTLATGFIHYRPSIFSSLRRNRISMKEASLNEKSDDVMRVVILHYLFSAASPPGSNKNTLSAMFVPLRAASRTHMAIAQTIIMEQQGRTIDTNEVHFTRNAFFFADIGRHCIQRLRLLSKIKYLEQIEKYFYAVVTNAIAKETAINLEKVAETINEHFDWLCRVWPYPRISVTFHQGPVPKGFSDAIEFLSSSRFHLAFDKSLLSPYYLHESYMPIMPEDGIPEDAPHTEKALGLGYLTNAEVKTQLKLATQRINKHIIQKRPHQ